MCRCYITNYMIMKKLILLFALISMVMMQSCMTTRTPVANYQMQEGEKVCYSKGRQCYLFWGLIPLGRTKVATPPDGVCEVRTSYGFWDAFLSVITGGIFEMQRIKVYVKKPVETKTASIPESTEQVSQTQELTQELSYQSE